MGHFSVKTKVVFGEGLESLTGQIQKAFLVTDPFMVESGKASYVTDCLKNAGRECKVFSDVSADPDIDVVTAGVDSLIEFQPDTVICLGGGAAIDAAKAIVYFAIKTGQAGEPTFIAIPTTSGTGSEVSSFSVITDRQKAIKYPLVDESLVPDIALLDANLVVSAPPSVTADTGIDVLTHAVEAFVSKQHTDFTDATAEKAIKLVKHHLLTCYKEPNNLEARQGMHNASCLAGIAFSNAGLGLNHGMAHALGAHFHIPHGRANGILLPYVMSYNAGCADSMTPTAKRYAQIARLLGLESSSIRQSALNVIRTTRTYMEKLKMPATIQAAGVGRDEFEAALDAMTASALADRCTATNPRECTAEEIKTVFRKAYAGKLP